MSGITLYHFTPSGPARVALLAVRALGLDVTVKEVDLFAGEHMKPEFIKVNPQHCVPTLDDNGFIIWESRAIALYLCDAYGGDKGAQLLPKDPKKRAVVNQRLFYDVSTLSPRLTDIYYPLLMLGETTVSEDKKEKLSVALGHLETILGKSAWVAGTNRTVADCSLLATVSTIAAIGFDITKFPNIVSWLARCKEQMPGYDENQEGADKFGAIIKSKLAGGQL